MEQNNILLYTTTSGDVKVEVRIENETVWLTQKAIAALFGVKIPAISKHLKNIFEAGELQESSVVSKMETTASDSKTYQTQYYNLDVIISVGYRVNSVQATWKNAPDGKILKSDVVVAKNYLNEAHLQELNRIVSAYLYLAENNAKRQLTIKMEDWAKFLDSFLQLSSYPILMHKGKVSQLEAKLKAESEYDKYRILQDYLYQSDFDKEINLFLENTK